MNNSTDKIRAALEMFETFLPSASHRAVAREALSLLEGHVIVPVEPTDTQIHAGMEALRMCPHPDAYIEYKNEKDETVYFTGAPSRQYRAMIAPYTTTEK